MPLFPTLSALGAMSVLEGHTHNRFFDSALTTAPPINITIFTGGESSRISVKDCPFFKALVGEVSKVVCTHVSAPNQVLDS